MKPEIALRNLASAVEILSQTHSGAGHAHHARRIRIDAGAHGSAQALNKYSWGFIKTGESEARLIHGVAESDVVTLVFLCDTKKKRVKIVTTGLPATARKGQPLRTTLRRRHRHYDGKIGTITSSEGYHFEASAAAEPTVVDILKSATSVTVGIPGHNERVPLKGLAKPLAQFEAACFRKTLTVQTLARAARQQRQW